MSELAKMERKLRAREWLIRQLGGKSSSPEPAWDKMREAVEDLQRRAAAFGEIRFKAEWLWHLNTWRVLVKGHGVDFLDDVEADRERS